MTNSKAPKGTRMNTFETAFDPVAAALKQMHQAVTNEEVPADFFKLLDEIDAKIAQAKSNTKPAQ